MHARSLLLVALVALALLAVCAPAAPAAPRLRACSGQPDFGCGSVSVPLDHSGKTAGRVRLRIAAERRRTPGGRLLIALSGGPGQPSVDAASAFAVSLGPALRRYRLLVLDQRGTGGSSLLRCPGVQGLRSLDPFTPGRVASCAARIGPRRAFFTTADTVLDLEELRKAFGVQKVALMGISYGTHVALQYARAFPQRVDRLILDSIVGPDGPDAFLLDTYRHIPRILREQCSRSACRGITTDPVADVAAVAKRLDERGPIRGGVFDERGRRRLTAYRDADELSFLLLSGDLNPFLQAALPAAIAATRRGDPSLLLRLRRAGQGAPTRVEDLSFGLNVATGCTDVVLPYPLSTPLPDRPALAASAMAAIPPADYAPFAAQTVLRTSYVDDCLRWPQDTVRPPFTGPLPDVPALLLGGRLDLRTPVENAHATHALLPHSTVVAVRGTGHDALDTDITGCTARALSRFIRNRPVGRPCANADNAVAPLPLPPRSLRDFRSAPGVGGRRGRVVFAVLDTASDARMTALQDLFAGVALRGGGLHGGRFSASAGLDGTVRLHRYAYLPGLRVSGTLDVADGTPSGRVRITGVRGAGGVLRLDGGGGASGVLGGRRVRYRPGRRGRGAAVAGAAGGRSPYVVRAPDGLRPPRVAGAR